MVCSRISYDTRIDIHSDVPIPFVEGACTPVTTKHEVSMTIT
jgi:hypothetical protein